MALRVDERLATKVPGACVHRPTVVRTVLVVDIGRVASLVVLPVKPMSVNKFLERFF